MKKLQDVDRCVRCDHHRVNFKDGRCRFGWSLYRGLSGCGCKCVFPSPSVSEAEDKNSNSVPGASDHPTSRIPKDILLTLAEIRKDLERGARPWYNTDIRALLSIIDTSVFTTLESATEVDFDNVTFYGFRYCLGRQTYVVSECVDILTRNWNRLTDATRTMIKKEIIQAFDQNRYGSEMDRAAWASVLDLDDPDPITQAAASPKERNSRDLPDESSVQHLPDYEYALKIVKKHEESYLVTADEYQPIPEGFRDALIAIIANIATPSPSESKSVDEAARRAAEKICGKLFAEIFHPARMGGLSKHNEAEIAEIITTELPVHQPDVQAADVRRIISDSLSMNSLVAIPASELRQLEQAICAALEVDEVSKEQQK